MVKYFIWLQTLIITTHIPGPRMKCALLFGIEMIGYLINGEFLLNKMVILIFVCIIQYLVVTIEFLFRLGINIYFL
jgi:hypothetical protein